MTDVFSNAFPATGGGGGDALEATSQEILALLQGVMNGDDSAVMAELNSTGLTAVAASVRPEVERMTGVRDWGVYGDAPLFEPAVSDNSMATWGTPVYDGTTRRLYYTAGNGSGSYVIRHIALDSAGLPTGSPTTVITGAAAYDAAGAFLPVVERESTTLHMFYCGMPSAFTNQNICYATASTSDPLTWTKQGVAIAYSDLPAYLHSGAEPTGLIKYGSTYYMYLCSTHGGAAAALGASTMDRRAAVATASSLSGPWTLTPLLCESTAESFQEPWIYQISPSVFRASSSSTALFYMISASGGVNTDYQQLELHESPTPMFARELTRHIGTILVPRDEGTGFPDWEIDVVGTLSDDISKNSRSCTSGALWLYFGGKSHSDGLWKIGLSKQTSVVKALRPPIQTRCHRYGTQLPLRAANLWEEEQTATLLLSTTIATVTSQTVFTLTAGASVNDAYNDQVVIITDASGRTVKGRAVVSDYVGSTRTLTLSAATSFTIAAGDSIRIDASGSASGGGGDATLAKQEEILALLAGVTTVTVSGYGLLDPYGTLQLKQGQTGDIVFTSSSADIVPDMTSAKVYLSVRAVSGRALMQVEGVVTTPTGTQVVTFTLTPTDANLLEPGMHQFDVMVIYGYAAGPPVTYTGARVFTGGACEVTRLELLPDTI